MSRLLFKSISGRWVINIPLGRHRVFVFGRGRLLKSGKFNNWLPCTNVVTLMNRYRSAPPKPIKRIGDDNA